MQKLKFTFSTLIALSICAFSIIGCETDEDNKISKAQECVDKLSPSAAASNDPALACEAMIAGVNDPAADVIRCSVRMYVGGVRDEAMLDAFEAYKNESDPDAKAGVLMAAIIMDDFASPATNITENAELARKYCARSGQASLEYIASLSYMSTAMSDAQGGTTDPATMANFCLAAPGNCDDELIGSTVISVYDSYCNGDNATDNYTCVTLGAAINTGGSDPAAVADALYNLLN